MITAAAAAFAFAVFTTPADAQTAPQQRPATLTVSGQGSTDRAPDRAFVTFSIVTNDDNAGRATSANNAAYNALVAKLATLGVSGPALKTASYGVSFNQRPPQPNPQYPQRYGYIVNRDVTVTIDRTDQVGAVIDAGVAAGATTVSSVGFGLRDARAAYRTALAAAMADADAQAHALADAAHQRIVRIVEIAAGSTSPGPRPLVLGQMKTAAAAVPTEITPSELTVTASVGVTYQIAP